MFDHILVPTDFSGPSDAALDLARGLAATFGSTLHLLHVVEAPSVTGPLGEAFGEETLAAQACLYEDARTRLRHRVGTSDGRFSVRCEIVGGASARAIVEYARERGMDLIVMGTHGRSGMAHVLMGSVAERVVRDASSPVLTVKHVSAPAAGRREKTVAFAG